MPLDKNTVVKGIKLALKNGPNKADANDNAGIDVALVFCLDELSDRQQSYAFLTSYSVTVTAADRTKVLEGQNADLRFIYAIKYGTGNDQKVLDFVEHDSFIREYDNPSASSGVPTYWTIIESEDGYPKIKFNCPAEESTTMTVYYHLDINEGTIAKMRSGYALVDGALAYYYGKATAAGAMYHANFKEGVALMRGSDKFQSNQGSRFETEQFEKNFRIYGQALKDKRR